MSVGFYDDFVTAWLDDGLCVVRLVASFCLIILLFDGFVVLGLAVWCSLYCFVWFLFACYVIWLLDLGGFTVDYYYLTKLLVCVRFC